MEERHRMQFFLEDCPQGDAPKVAMFYIERDNLWMSGNGGNNRSSYD